MRRLRYVLVGGLRRLRRLLGVALLNRSNSWPLAVGELNAGVHLVPFQNARRLEPTRLL